ncbi:MULTISPECIES: peptidoglycan-associated lipoprotein Pal [Chromohalobacter]|uniref:Peptidoglycan-associated lipoprotein n=2 Tax=Chromohalobacter TaxID=42054 RepID=A0A285VSX4_9GAMM|nr:MULTISPECIES: peptidoglycan-associated lipoprotein Pal [Chromohalobacter]MCK0753775.1 peptidoglycan-associated lipoprotein Pal [Chromohalobacter japonicus]MCK0766096.1 peptidoglycan-associated lipoprotein Pal [Chromohalobacter beijerinckii]SOC57159.1 peptidoglycan-associated lipoprotein [Chromohalobacter canadensis]
MQFKPYAQGLAVAISLAVLAGCSSTGGTQDGSMDGTSGTGAGGSDSASSQGMESGQGTSGSEMGDRNAIPEERTIYFAFDRDTIRPEFESVLEAHAQYLKNHPNTDVVLEGHADERGTREYNLGLGERRAQAVEQYLSVEGVSSSQVEIVSYGEERPAVRGHDEESYAQNRRVVFSY